MHVLPIYPWLCCRTLFSFQSSLTTPRPTGRWTREDGITSVKNKNYTLPPNTLPWLVHQFICATRICLSFFRRHLPDQHLSLPHSWPYSQERIATGRWMMRKIISRVLVVLSNLHHVTQFLLSFLSRKKYQLI
jgi:hypothetical protein